MLDSVVSHLVERAASDPWAGWALGTDGLEARYCELNRLGAVLRQPSNALSSLAYVVAGGFVLGQRGGAVPRPLRLLLGASLAALGAGSIFFHGSITLVAQQLDMTATYGTVLSLIAIAATKLGARSNAMVLGGGVVGADVAAYGFDLYRHGTWLLPLLIGLALLASVTIWSRSRAAGPRWSFFSALAGLVIGGVSWVLDGKKVGCRPEGVLQWHALWHVATAIGVWALFAYFDEPSEAARS